MLFLHYIKWLKIMLCVRRMPEGLHKAEMKLQCTKWFCLFSSLLAGLFIFRRIQHCCSLAAPDNCLLQGKFLLQTSAILYFFNITYVVKMGKRMTGDTGWVGKFILKIINVNGNRQIDWYGHYFRRTFIDVGSLWLWDVHP